MATKRKSKSRVADFAAIKDRADSIIQALSARDTEFDKSNKIYLIDPDSETGKSDREKAKYLYDGHGHAVVDAIVRTWNANPANISVPTPDPKAEGLTAADIASREKARAAAEKAENFLKALRYQSDSVTQRDHQAMVLKANTLWAECTVDVVNMLAIQSEPEAPFVFRVPLPKLCYPRYSDLLGVLQHVFKTTVTYADVRATYGDKATAFLTGDDDDPATLIDYIDREVHVVWVDEEDGQPILNLAHNLPFIPRVSMICGANEFFEDEKDKRQPFLYAYLNSGTWAARNLQKTLMNTNLTNFINAALISHTKDGQGIGIDLREPYGEIPLEIGEDAQQLVLNRIPPEQLRFSGELTMDAEELTLSKVSMGAGEMSGNSPAAAIAALTQNALVATKDIKRSTERALSKAYSIVLQWIVERGEAVSVWSPNGTLEELAPSDLTIDGTEYTHVEVELVEDKQQLRQMVAGLVGTLFAGGRGLIGLDTAYQLLESGGIGDAKKMKQDWLETQMLMAHVPEIAKQASAEANAIAGVVQAIPSAPAAGAPPGTMPGNVPTPEQLLSAVSASGAAQQQPQGGEPLPPTEGMPQ